MKKTALMFAGQGAQAVGMGKDLALQYPTARALAERANTILGYDLTQICFEGPDSELTKTANAQPGIYLVGWIAFTLIRERVPALQFGATAGLSLGEFTALAAAGTLAFEDGLRVVRQRGKLMQEACEGTQGAMAAIIGLPENLTRTVCLETGVELANLNCPGQLVISGERGAIAKACELAKVRGAKKALPLTVAGAYHSRLMAQAQPRLAAVLGQIRFEPMSATVVSNVTAEPYHADPVELRARLVEQVTSPVRWEASMRGLLAQGYNQFIELGPGKALSGFMKRIDSSVTLLNVADSSSLENAVSILSSQDSAAARS